VLSHHGTIPWISTLHDETERTKVSEGERGSTSRTHPRFLVPNRKGELEDEQDLGTIGGQQSVLLITGGLGFLFFLTGLSTLAFTRVPTELSVPLVLASAFLVALLAISCAERDEQSRHF